MYLDYVKTFLSADERLTERQRDRIAGRIVSWAEANKVTDFGRLYEELTDWVDEPTIKEQKFASIEQPIGEEGDFSILQDPKAQTAPELLIAGIENIMTAQDLQHFIAEENPELSGLAASILNVNGGAVYREDDLDTRQIQHRLTVVASRVKCGKLLVPDKEVLSVGFDSQGDLQIRYKRGYSDEKFQRVLEMRLDGRTYREISETTSVSILTIGNWMRSCGLGWEFKNQLQKQKAYETIISFFEYNGSYPRIKDLDFNARNYLYPLIWNGEKPVNLWASNDCFDRYGVLIRKRHMRYLVVPNSDKEYQTKLRTQRWKPIYHL